MRYNCHAHIFTFRSVFTEGTLSILVNRLGREGWPDFATRAAEKVLLKHIRGDMLDENTLLTELVGALKADQGLKNLINAGEATLPPSLSVALDGDISGLAVGALREIIAKLGGEAQANGEAKVGKADFGDFLAFFDLGIKPSIEAVAAKLLEYSGPDTAAVALMMDITMGGAADDQLFQTQLEDTATAALVFPGRILPFVAVNPQRTSHFERMTYALEQRGFVGVKLYPSLGYPVDSAAMRKVYDYCLANDTPLLLHCNHGGFYRDLASIEFCDPAAWEPILHDYPNLRVCFGHFGGDEDLVKAVVPPDSWASRIIGLMQRYPRIYADLSYHDNPMAGGANETNYFQNLAGILNDPILGSRILFGSDFHLVRQRVRDDNLWRFFATRFSPDHFTKITVTNPVAFLGLPKDDGSGSKPNIVRHLHYLAKHNAEVREQPAAWALTAIQSELGAVTFYPNEFGSGWLQNNEAHFYTDSYFRTLMSPADAQRLSFLDAGRMRMRDLVGWPSEALPAEIRTAALLQIATRLQAFVTQTPNPGAIIETGVTSDQARQAFVSLLGSPDRQVAEFGSAVDQLYHFKSEKPSL
jgi:predicted TIM-barrel fold metal-dependent hydrolase